MIDCRLKELMLMEKLSDDLVFKLVNEDVLLIHVAIKAISSDSVSNIISTLEKKYGEICWEYKEPFFIFCSLVPDDIFQIMVDEEIEKVFLQREIE